MTDLVNDGGAQNYREFELGVIYLGEAQSRTCEISSTRCQPTSDGKENNLKKCVCRWFVLHSSLCGPMRVLRYAADLCSAESRCDLTQQFLRANIHGAARREHLALVSGNWLATHADGCLGAVAGCGRNPECLAPSSREVVPDCSG